MVWYGMKCMNVNALYLATATHFMTVEKNAYIDIYL